MCVNSQNIKSSLPAIHEVGNAGIFVMLEIENKMDREISHFNYNSKHYEKSKSALKLTALLFTVYFH